MRPSVAFARPRHILEESVLLAESLGLRAFGVPSMEILPLPESELDPLRRRVLDNVESAVIFTTALALRFFLGEGKGKELLRSSLRERDLYAIGPGTARAMEGAGLPADELPSEHSSRGLVDDFGGRLSGRPVTLVRSKKGTALLREGLIEAGALVDEMRIYGSEPVLDSPEMRELLEHWSEHGLGALALTSALTSRYFLDSVRGIKGEEWLKDHLEGVRIGAIGEPTAVELRAQGICFDLTSTEADFEALLRALKELI